jgi:hypothetical protein
MCPDAAEADRTDEHGGRGEVIECLRQKLLTEPGKNLLNNNCVEVKLAACLYKLF